MNSGKLPLQTHHLNCEVFIAGGGPAGAVAALAAARRGARVILCQDRPMLGGNASSEVRMHIVGADQSGKRGKPLEVEAREGGIIEEIRLENCVRNPQRSPSMFDLILYEKCRAEPNLTLMLNTTVVGAEMEQNRIRAAIAERQSTEDRFVIAADVFLDCTGDGRLALEAGAPFLEGREAREQFGESLAQKVADNQRLGSSLMLQARKHDRPMPFQAPPWARKFTEDDLRLRPHAMATEFGDLGLEYGFWWLEWGGQFDTIKDNEKIRDELLAILIGVWDHIKNGGDHGAENWALEWCGFVPGKRESRRFLGQYVLTQNDVVGSEPFDDAIAYGGWFIDTHPPAGVDDPAALPCVHHDVPHLYDIPLRACVSKTIDNLMFAGRNISATHIAFASTRVMATCAVVGQGVGTAAAYAVKHKLSPASLAQDAGAIEKIQQQLLEDDAFLIGQANRDPRDLAICRRGPPQADSPTVADKTGLSAKGFASHKLLSAFEVTVTASSEQPEGPAKNAIAGPTRSVHGEAGAPRERVVAGTHRWMSDPARGLPAWIELRWPQPIRAAHVQMIFDTGLDRVLTFTLADSYAKKMCWGRAQPETVRDYRLELQSAGQWRAVAEIKDNYQRLNRIALDDQPFDALRITVTATNGLDHARICEIRVVTG